MTSKFTFCIENFHISIQSPMVQLIKARVCWDIAWHRLCDKPLPKQMLICFTDAYISQRRAKGYTHLSPEYRHWLWVLTKRWNSINLLLQFWYWNLWYQVIHVVHINNLHSVSCDHVHQHFAEKSFWIYQECFHIEINTWRSQWYNHLYH